VEVQVLSFALGKIWVFVDLGENPFLLLEQQEPTGTFHIVLRSNGKRDVRIVGIRSLEVFQAEAKCEM
jgi:hypothetical protein